MTPWLTAGETYYFEIVFFDYSSISFTFSIKGEDYIEDVDFDDTGIVAITDEDINVKCRRVTNGSMLDELYAMVCMDDEFISQSRMSEAYYISFYDSEGNETTPDEAVALYIPATNDEANVHYADPDTGFTMNMMAYFGNGELMINASASGYYVVTEPISYCPEYYDGFILGDVDCSDEIESIDVTLIQRYLCGLRTDLPLDPEITGDIDGDDELTIIDATLLQRWLAGLDTPYDDDIGSYYSLIYYDVDPEISTPDEEWTWPTPGYYYLTSEYGEGRSYETHDAVDIAAATGTPVYAANSGTVVSSFNGCTHYSAGVNGCSCGGGYGNYVWIMHDNGYETIYGHMISTVVSTGQYVSNGQLIGYVGSTGWSTGPHLHFELRINGVKSNPMNLY